MSDNINNQNFCIRCLEDVEVKCIEQLGKGGKHIKFGRYATPFGSLYNHHAIVTKVDRTTTEVTYFEFGGDDLQLRSDFGASIREVTLQFKKLKNASIVVYRNLLFSEEEIVQRTKRLLSQENWSSYILQSNNCEHLAMYIMTDIRVCFQKDEKFNILRSYCGVPTAIKDVLSWIKNRDNIAKVLEGLGKFVKYFKGLIRECLEEAVSNILVTGANNLLKVVKIILKGLKCFIHGGVLLYLCYDVWTQIQQIKEMSKKVTICDECRWKCILKLVCRALLGVISLVLFYVPGLYGTIFSLGIIGYDLILAPLCKAIGESIHPAYNVPKWKIKSFEELRVGDIATIEYWSLSHEVVVTEILPAAIILTIATFRADGHGDNAWINVEDVTLPLLSSKWEKTSIERYDYSGNETYPPDEVVGKVNHRLSNQDNGKYRYPPLKLINEIKLVNKKHCDKTPPKQLTKLINLCLGDVIEIQTCDRKRTAILLDYQFSQDPSTTKCIRCIHYAWSDMCATRTITEELVQMDITRDRLQRHDYSGHLTYTTEETLRRAKSRLGEQKFNTITNRSSHFAKYCKVKDIEAMGNEARIQTGVNGEITQSRQALEMVFSTEESDKRAFGEELNKLSKYFMA